MNGWIALISAALFGASLSVCFKIFAKFNIDSLQCVFVNYITAVVVSLSLGGGLDGLKAAVSAPWAWLAVIEGAGFMGGMLLLASSSKHAGVALTNTSARASLVVPVLMSYFIYHEQMPSWTAIVMVLVAMVLVFGNLGGPKESHSFKDALMPLAVFASYGLTDFLLKALKAKAGADSAQGGIMLFIFGTAAVLCLVAYLVRGKFAEHPFSWKSLVGGVVLGLCNSFCTALMLKALGIIDAVVFYPVYNVSVVTISLLVGVFFFKERLSWVQLGGVVLAAFAIVLLVI